MESFLNFRMHIVIYVSIVFSFLELTLSLAFLGFMGEFSISIIISIIFETLDFLLRGQYFTLYIRLYFISDDG